MQFTTSSLVTLALAASTAFAAPAEQLSKRGPQWQIQQFTRSCDAANLNCGYSFGINSYDGPVTQCRYNVAGNPASQAPQNGVACGNFYVTSGWSGQFGPGNGFTTLSVKRGNQIAFPAYTDAELQNGRAVNPDKSFAVSSF